jgi:hypothetical protein
VPVIRERNDDGVLVAAGYAWVEQKDTPGLPLFVFAWASAVVSLFGMWMALAGSTLTGLAIAAGGIALAWWSRRARKEFGQARRALVFRADGTVAAGDPPAGPLPIKLSEIADVTFDLQYDTPYIALKAKDGTTIDVADGRGLTDDDGRLIHAELVEAWDEIRRARGDVPWVMTPRPS